MLKAKFNVLVTSVAGTARLVVAVRAERFCIV